MVRYDLFYIGQGVLEISRSKCRYHETPIPTFLLLVSVTTGGWKTKGNLKTVINEPLESR